jgi:Na+-driven multidrug efflux pump
MIPVGLCSATNFLTGKYIGKDKPNLAKKISNLCMFVTFVWSMVSMVLVYSFDNAIMSFYTHDESV